MREITVLCVGKLKETFWKEACAEYEKRLGAYTRLQIIELPEHRLSLNPSKSEIQQGLDAEAQAILGKIPKGAELIALCIEGNGVDSQALSARMSELAGRGVSKLCFVIGGSFGLADRVKELAGWKLSMSRMTFPHHLARVMLLEQVYRAFQIQQNGSYHK